MDAGLERRELRLICRQKDGRRKRVSVCRNHKNKGIRECVSQSVSNLIAKGRLMFVYRANEALGGIIDFISLQCLYRPPK